MWKLLPQLHLFTALYRLRRWPTTDPKLLFWLLFILRTFLIFCVCYCVMWYNIYIYKYIYVVSFSFPVNQVSNIHSMIFLLIESCIFYYSMNVKSDFSQCYMLNCRVVATDFLSVLKNWAEMEVNYLLNLDVTDVLLKNRLVVFAGKWNTECSALFSYFAWICYYFFLLSWHCYKLEAQSHIVQG